MGVWAAGGHESEACQVEPEPVYKGPTSAPLRKLANCPRTSPRSPAAFFHFNEDDLVDLAMVHSRRESSWKRLSLFSLLTG